MSISNYIPTMMVVLYGIYVEMANKWSNYSTIKILLIFIVCSLITYIVDKYIGAKRINNWLNQNNIRNHLLFIVVIFTFALYDTFLRNFSDYNIVMKNASQLIIIYIVMNLVLFIINWYKKK